MELSSEDRSSKSIRGYSVVNCTVQTSVIIFSDFVVWNASIGDQF